MTVADLVFTKAELLHVAMAELDRCHNLENSAKYLSRHESFDAIMARASQHRLAARALAARAHSLVPV